jgi:hypothetical protein
LNGASYICKEDGKFYRQVGEVIHNYPDNIIGESWDPAFRLQPVRICKDFILGEDMKIKTPPPPPEKEGGSIKCNGVPSTVYRRYTTDKMLYPYPNPEIASSWDPNWPNAPSINCAGHHIGSPMKLKSV